MTKTTITPDLIRAALAHIPASLARDEWARVAMAVKSEFSDDTGRELFETWSATADNYDAQATRTTWRSIKAGGGVGIGTLLHLAKQHGFELPRGNDAPAPPSAAEQARRDQERAQRLRDEQAQQAAAHAHAAQQAAARWAAASDTGESPYLERKQVQAYGVRFEPDGTVLVPVRDGDGVLWNLQSIAPERPAHGPDKLFLKGGRKAGLWHWCGNPAGAAVLLVAEGYATAASVHLATAHPVAVAFDAGNLQAVAQALHQRYPAALVVVAGDDDRATEAKTGTNPGRKSATAAARAVQGLAVFPTGAPAGEPVNWDFNDMRQALGLLDVRECIMPTIAAHQNAQRAQASKPPRAPRVRAPAAAPVGGGGQDDGDNPDDPFTVGDDGVRFHGRDKDGAPLRPLWLCSRLDVVAATRNQDGADWGYLLSFADPLNIPKQWAMPARMLSGDGGEYRAALLNMGLRIAPGAAARNRLTEYIQTRKPPEFASCTDRIGWHGGAFVLPHETIGDDSERIVFQSESQMENTFRVRGDVANWRQRIGALCVGNSRLAFAVACAFAGPLLRPGGMESGGFHYRGDSSSGKTTGLRVGASVNGGTNYMQRWRTTDNALEAIAAQHCDSLLILDELAQVEGRVAGECAYLLANEQSKARATRNGAPRARLSWRLLFLSAGELGLADHMAEGMKRARTGQEVRMADIPADAGAGMGAFENIHGFAGPAQFASHLTREVQACYGAPGRAFIEWACANADTLARRVRTATASLAAEWMPHGAAGQVERVGARFALVGVAGELATEAGLTGWPAGESARAAKACFDSWLAARGGSGNGEVAAMLRQVRKFLETHGEGRFAMWHRSADDHAPKTLQRAGVRRMLNAQGEPIKSNSQFGTEYGDRMAPAAGEEVSFEYFVLAETFKGEVCQGFDPVAVCKVLESHGCLMVKEPGRYTTKQRLPGIGNVRCYQVAPTIFELDL